MLAARDHSHITPGIVASVTLAWKNCGKPVSRNQGHPEPSLPAIERQGEPAGSFRKGALIRFSP
jgi:hypothetical protein